MPSPPADRHADRREARRLALSAVFEAEFGLRTPERILERHLGESDAPPETASHSRDLVEAVTRQREAIDNEIERLAPTYPMTQMARIDRAILRCAVAELLHCPTTPARVAISEWVELARTYSGEPARRLVNGVLGQAAHEAVELGPDERPSDTTSDRA